MKKKARIELLETQLIEAKNRLLGCRMAARSNLAALRKSWQIDLGHMAALEAGLAKLEADLMKYKQCTDVLCSHCHDVDKEGE